MGRWQKIDKRELVNFIVVLYMVAFVIIILMFLASLPSEERPRNFVAFVTVSIGALIAASALLVQMFLSRADKKKILDTMDKNQKELVSEMDSIKDVLLRVEWNMKAGRAPSL